MAISWDDFDKIWASTSPLTPYNFSEVNYKQGWNFVGATPPARQMWDSIQKKNDEKFKYLRDNFGTPNIVTSSSQMTDTDKVYVYMGSEAGWNSGHWYYYDEGTSSWADGGVYNSVAFVTDTTLSIAGQPADAKATGDALALKSDLAGCTFTGNVSVNADLSVTGDATIGTDLSVTGDSSLTNLSVSGTTALAGTSTAPTPSADDNSTKIATTEYVQTEIKPIEVNADIVNKRVTNIVKLLQGNLYDYQTDTDSAYVKTVPAGAMPYASLEQIGGKTLVWNQVLRLASGTSTKYDVTMVFDVDGTITLSGTATETVDVVKVIQSYTYILGHVYWLRGCPQGSSSATFFINTNNGRSDAGGLVFTANNSTTTTLHCVVNNGVNVDGVVIKVQLTDLTLVFGAGNEPTLEECRTMFPAESYPYNAGTLLSAGVTEVVSKKADTTEIATYPIPAEIRNLEGYGWSAGSVYNYIDFERKVFVKNVGAVDLGTLTWGSSSSSGKKYFFSSSLSSEIKYVAGSNDVVNNIIYPYGSTGTFFNAYNGVFDCIAVGGQGVNEGRIAIYDSTKEEITTAEFKASLSGVYAYYELATPQEIDISAYLTDDNLISVDSGGTLTFPNANGDDYRIPVPSEETYMINLQEAVSNG